MEGAPGPLRAWDPRHLGAEIGFLVVLHTWGQTLLLHPHLRCVVPGGGLSVDGQRWIPCRKGFFLPVRVLSRLFRGKMLALLAEAHRAGRLAFHGRLADLQRGPAWNRLLCAIRAKEWEVYAKPPFGGPEQVLKYLAHYTHRVALTKERLTAFEDGQVTSTRKDYAAGSRRRAVTRANRARRHKLARTRELLGEDTPASLAATTAGETAAQPCAPLCPACVGPLMWVEDLPPAATALEEAQEPPDPG